MISAVLPAGNAEAALRHLRKIMGKLKLTVNEEKTRICKVPEGEFDFLGFTFGRMYSLQRLAHAFDRGDRDAGVGPAVKPEDRRPEVGDQVDRILRAVLAVPLTDRRVAGVGRRPADEQRPSIPGDPRLDGGIARRVEPLDGRPGRNR